MTTDLRYPIGRFTRPERLDDAQRSAMIDAIARAPGELGELAAGLTDAQLYTPYREGGWTVRQVLHHVPDSHMNAYVRFKLALTEDRPTIKPYDEGAWATLHDTVATPVETSLALLGLLHQRLVILLRSLGPDDFARTLVHPESGVMTLDALLAMYAWHGAHHAAHIRGLRERSGW